MEKTKKIKYTLAGVLLSLATYLITLAMGLTGGASEPVSRLGSVSLADNCYTALATTTRVYLDKTSTASTTLLTCSAGSANGIALNFISEASSTATLTYGIQSSQDNITFYDVVFGQINVLTSTTTKQISLEPFYGNRIRIQASSTANTSTNVRLLVAEEIAR